MKLSKKSWLILTIVILIIASASLGVAHSQQVHEQRRLSEELSLAGSRLNRFQFEQLSSQQKELEEQLSQIVSQSETSDAASPQPIRSIAINDSLLNIAKARDVKIIDISTSGAVSGDLEGIPCRILTLTTRVEGDTPNLIRFTTDLIDNLTNSVIKSVEINIPRDTSKAKSSANIKLAIYYY